MSCCFYKTTLVKKTMSAPQEQKPVKKVTKKGSKISDIFGCFPGSERFKDGDRYERPRFSNKIIHDVDQMLLHATKTYVQRVDEDFINGVKGHPNVASSNLGEEDLFADQVEDGEKDLFEDIEEEELNAALERIKALEAAISKTKAETEAYRKSQENQRRDEERKTEEKLASCKRLKEQAMSIHEEYKKVKEDTQDHLICKYTFEDLFKTLKIDPNKGVCGEGKPVICNGPAGFYSEDKVCKIFECPKLTDSG